MLHFVTSYMKENKSRKQTLESAQYGLEISFNSLWVQIKTEMDFGGKLCKKKLNGIMQSLMNQIQFQVALFMNI